MSTESFTTNEPAGGDGLLFGIAFAVVGVVGAEAFFIAYSSWWLMVAVLVFAMLAAGGVAAALVRMMDDKPRAKPEPDVEPVTRPAPAPRAAVIAH